MANLTEVVGLDEVVGATIVAVDSSDLSLVVVKDGIKYEIEVWGMEGMEYLQALKVVLETD